MAYGKKIFQQGKARNVGALQSQVKKKFGKGIPPANLGEVFGTSPAKRAQRKKKASQAGRQSTSTLSAPKRATTRSEAFDLETSSGSELDRWMDLVAYLNRETGGRPHFSIRLDGTSTTLVSD